jgi:DNA-binding Lrp family transcriptional regulator
VSATPSAEARLLLALQKGLPIDPRPFERVGAPLGLSEAQVLEHVRAWFASGVARRFGAVFDSRRLGYSGTLCAVDVPAAGLEAAAAVLAPHAGITHCYEREGRPNLWFTLTAPAAGLEAELGRLAGALGLAVLNLPALRKFKIEAVFGREDKEDTPRPAEPEAPEAVAPFSERERQVVRCLQASIAVHEDPFGDVARRVGYPPDELLALLARWQTAGVIRRIGLVVRHRELGFSANSMCVWKTPAERIEPAGRILARSPHVTHCYERPAFPAFPFNLYAMIHAKSRDEAVAIFEGLGAAAALAQGRMMWSVREFKKASPVFFTETRPEGIASHG